MCVCVCVCDLSDMFVPTDALEITGTERLQPSSGPGSSGLPGEGVCVCMCVCVLRKEVSCVCVCVYCVRRCCVCV